MSITVPDDRIFTLNDQPLRHDGEYVLYWMISNRRLHWNFSLDRAVALANELNKPLVILEALRCDHRWASDRIHRFVIQGMRENQQFAQSSDCSIHSYVEPSKGAGKGLLQELSRKACAVITDYFPCFFLPRMTQKAAQKIAVRVESIDSNGLYPLQKVEREFTTAASLRRHLQKTIRPHLKQLPQADPLSLRQNKTLTDIGGVEERWPSADFDALLSPDGLRDLPIDHSVRPIRNKGGRSAAVQRKKAFLTSKINRYHSDRNQIENTAASGLSPYLHFGYVSAHELWADIQQQERWSEAKLPEKATGSREGWWNMSPGAEALMDELITWRELGYIFCHRHLDDYDKLSSLPDWALKTIAEHKDDPRPVTYTLQQLEQAQTHDELWNCAQRQLATEGVIHNYLRMLWGKKIYEWSDSAEQALEHLVELNNKYAIDGRNPNSYSGIFWIMGRFDRAWGPVRPIFGKLRYMTSASTARKLDVKTYRRRFSSGAVSRP